MTDQKPAKKETSDEDKPVIKKRDNFYEFNIDSLKPTFSYKLE